MTADELRIVVERLRRRAPMDRDVQTVCDALRGVLDMQPLPDRKARRLARAQYVAYRREYRRVWELNKRRRLKAAKEQAQLQQGG